MNRGNSMVKEWNYGNASKRYPIEPNEIWSVDDGKGRIKVHDLYNPLPSFMLEADMIIVDPPWNLSLVNSFYTKADKQGEHKKTFHDFYKQLFKQIDNINPKKIFIEIGKQNVDKFKEELEQRFPIVEVWNITYFRKNPCFFLRASHTEKSSINYEGMDEWDAILLALKEEEYEIVADLCMGQGLVGFGAYTSGKRFVGTELNLKRLAVLIEKIMKKGGTWTKEEAD